MAADGTNVGQVAAEPAWVVALDRNLGSIDRRGVLSATLDAALHFSGAPMGNVQLVDRQENVLRIVAQHGFQRRFLQFFEIVRSDMCACGSAMQSAQPVVVEDVASSPVFDESSRTAVLEAGVKSVISMPIIDRTGRVAAVVSVHFRREGTPAPRVLTMINLVSVRASQLL